MKLWVLAFVALFVLLASPFFGPEFISVERVLNGESSFLFYELRIPRSLITFMAGAGLALSGMTFQSLFRNDLATPYTLGVSTGASLGVSLFIASGIYLSGGTSLFAFFGALLSVIIVYGIGQTKAKMHMNVVLLAGVAMAMTFSSFIMLIQVLVKEMDAVRIIRWLMGSIDVVGMESVYAVAPFFFVGIIFIYKKRVELNLITMGESVAYSRGVDTERLRKHLFLMTSLLVAGIVSECGPIGFVGMMIPHIGREVVGADHRKLFWFSLLAGGSFLILCDLIGRVFFDSLVLPVGVITALLGGPFFLYLILKKK